MLKMKNLCSEGRTDGGGGGGESLVRFTNGKERIIGDHGSRK